MGSRFFMPDGRLKLESFLHFFFRLKPIGKLISGPVGGNSPLINFCGGFSNLFLKRFEGRFGQRNFRFFFLPFHNSNSFTNPDRADTPPQEPAFSLAQAAHRLSEKHYTPAPLPTSARGQRVKSEGLLFRARLGVDGDLQAQGQAFISGVEVIHPAAHMYMWRIVGVVGENADHGKLSADE